MCAQRVARPRRVRRLVRIVLVAVVLVLVAIGSVAVLSGRYQVRPVLSGSMRPGLPVGGVVVTKRVPISSLRVRDVVVFHRPDQPQELVVHRIISITHGANGVVVQTQGDANNARDPWKVTLRGTTAYRAVFSVPLVGYAAVWVHNPNGRRTLLLIGLLLLAGTATLTVASRRRSAIRAAATAEDDPDDEPDDTAAPDENTDADAQPESQAVTV